MSDVRALVRGRATGEALVLGVPLSFWGGVGPESGVIIDQRHPRAGESVTGRMLVMPAGRGSSSAASVLAETIRLGVGPAGIILQHPDEILVLGALAAELLYGVTCPILKVGAEVFSGLAEGSVLIIDGDRLSTS